MSDDQEQSPTILPLPWWAVILIFMFCWPSIVFAEPIYEDAQFSLRLLAKPCTAEEVLKFLQPDVRPLYREATFVWEGRGLKSCWRPDGAVIRTMDEEGDALTPPIPLHVFKEDVSV